MWRNRIHALCPAAEFSEGCSQAALVSVEKALRVALPAELRELLRESDGIAGEDGLGLCWSAQRIRDDNQEFRSNEDFRELYMPFDPLLFFADAGNGDQFAFVICAGRISRPDIFVWDHETDSRTWVAPSLETFFDWWLSGRLEL